MSGRATGVTSLLGSDCNIASLQSDPKANLEMIERTDVKVKRFPEPAAHLLKHQYYTGKGWRERMMV